jgi:hypothetical protein
LSDAPQVGLRDAAMTQMTLLFVFAVERVTGHPT